MASSIIESLNCELRKAQQRVITVKRSEIYGLICFESLSDVEKKTHEVSFVDNSQIPNELSVSKKKRKCLVATRIQSYFPAFFPR